MGSADKADLRRVEPSWAVSKRGVEDDRRWGQGKMSLLGKICCATNASEEQASSSSSGKTACSRKCTLASSIIDRRGLAPSLSLGAHSTRVLDM